METLIRCFTSTLYALITCIFFSSANAAENISTSPTINHFATTHGLGFDKQISIWLVEKYISPGKAVVIFSGDIPPENTRVFDEAGADHFRSADRSTYEQLADAYAINNEATTYFKKIVFDIEINLWLPDEHVDSQPTEKAFRALQERWGRDQVPHACYTEFFDSLESLYYEKKSLGDSETILGELRCWNDALKNLLADPTTMVTEMPIPLLLGHMRSGAKVAFVDVREPDEFLENHIPGAINFLIKDANSKSVENLKGYDIIVAYCIKDFRGFEMAKKLKSLGVQQAVILNPYGIKGWIDSKLPVYLQSSVNEQDAETLLNTCIHQPSNCKSN